MTSSEKKSGRPIFRAACRMASIRSLIGQFAALSRPGVFQFLVGVLDHDDRRIDHRANGDGDAAQRHDVGRQVHRGERE